MTVTRLSIIKSFSRSQIAAFVAKIVDFGLLFLMVEVFGVWYVAATASGACCGGVTNFLLNRHWSFKANHKHWPPQAFKYALVSGSSLLLNTFGVYAVTELGRVHYGFSVFAVSVLVAVFFNFPMHRLVVFR